MSFGKLIYARDAHAIVQAELEAALVTFQLTNYGEPRLSEPVQDYGCKSPRKCWNIDQSLAHV